MTKTQTRPKAKPKSTLRRRIVMNVIVGGIAEARIKSLTRDDGTVHHPRVCVETGAVHCSCEQFFFRIKSATLANPNRWCKHLQRHIAALMRRGEIGEQWLQLWLRPCIGCGIVDAENEIAPDGQHVTGYVCNACETAWNREMNAGTPVGLCPGCCHPENVCEAEHICEEWEALCNELEVMADVDFDN